MSELAQAVAMLLSSARDPDLSGPEALHDHRVELFEAAFAASDDERAAAVTSIAEAVADPELPVARAGLLAITAGALVENGAPTTALGDVLLGRLPAILGDSKRFQDACLAAFPEGERTPEAEWVAIGDRQIPPETVASVAENDRVGAGAWRWTDEWCLPTIACLTRDRELRARAHRDEALRRAARDALGYGGFLCMALEVLDDARFLVLHASERRGFEVTVGGVADNFQLHTLLADALVREGDEGPEHGLPGERPAPEVIAVARGDGPQHDDGASARGTWNLYGWRALDPDGRLPADVPQERWIWNEGRPLEIETFEKRRVVILGPPAYPRTWNVARVFDALRGEVRLDRILGPAESGDLLAELGAAAASPD